MEVTYSCVGGEGVEGGGYIIYLWGGGDQGGGTQQGCLKNEALKCKPSAHS